MRIPQKGWRVWVGIHEVYVTFSEKRVLAVFLFDMLFDCDDNDGSKNRCMPIPFGKQDCTVFHGYEH